MRYSVLRDYIDIYIYIYIYIYMYQGKVILKVLIIEDVSVQATDITSE